MIRAPLTLLILASLVAPAFAEAPLAIAPRPIDPTDTIAAMLAAAYRTGDDATIQSVVGVAKATFPDQAVEIDRLAAGDAAVLATSRKEEQVREQQRIAEATFFEIWKGELELGASRGTGSANVTGIFASAKLSRDGLLWRQKLNGRIDYQRTDAGLGLQVLVADRLTVGQVLERVASVGGAPEVVVHRSGLGDRAERRVAHRVADLTAEHVVLPAVDLAPLHAPLAEGRVEVAGEGVERLVVVVVGVEGEVIELGHTFRVPAPLE